VGVAELACAADHGRRDRRPADLNQLINHAAKQQVVDRENLGRAVVDVVRLGLRDQPMAGELAALTRPKVGSLAACPAWQPPSAHVVA
jgi:hypothetical protein